jgi:hypothetical protein
LPTNVQEHSCSTGFPFDPRAARHQAQQKSAPCSAGLLSRTFLRSSSLNPSRHGYAKINPAKPLGFRPKTKKKQLPTQELVHSRAHRLQTTKPPRWIFAIYCIYVQISTILLGHRKLDSKLNGECGSNRARLTGVSRAQGGSLICNGECGMGSGEWKVSGRMPVALRIRELKTPMRIWQREFAVGECRWDWRNVRVGSLFRLATQFLE